MQPLAGAAGDWGGEGANAGGNSNAVAGVFGVTRGPESTRLHNDSATSQHLVRGGGIGFTKVRN